MDDIGSILASMMQCYVVAHAQLPVGLKKRLYNELDRLQGIIVTNRIREGSYDNARRTVEERPSKRPEHALEKVRVVPDR